MCQRKWWRVLLNVLVLTSELYTALERIVIIIDRSLATHPFESRFSRHILDDRNRVCRSERNGIKEGVRIDERQRKQKPPKTTK